MSHLLHTPPSPTLLRVPSYLSPQAARLAQLRMDSPRSGACNSLHRSEELYSNLDEYSHRFPLREEKPTTSSVLDIQRGGSHRQWKTTRPPSIVRSFPDPPTNVRLDNPNPSMMQCGTPTQRWPRVCRTRMPNPEANTYEPAASSVARGPVVSRHLPTGFRRRHTTEHYIWYCYASTLPIRPCRCCIHRQCQTDTPTPSHTHQNAAPSSPGPAPRMSKLASATKTLPHLTACTISWLALQNGPVYLCSGGQG